MSDVSDVSADELESLRARVASLERFAKRVAHELTTPLTTARGFASLLLEEDHEPATADALRRVERAVHRAERIVRRLLEDADGGVPRPVRAGDLVEDAVAALREDGTPLAVAVSRASVTEPFVFVRPGPARAACAELLEAMAAHAVATGGSRLEVETGRATGGTVDVRVVADGAGLDAEERRHVRTGGGTASSLPRRLRDVADRAAALGGRLWVDEDVPGHEAGVSVLLGLPLFTESDGD